MNRIQHGISAVVLLLVVTSARMGAQDIAPKLISSQISRHSPSIAPLPEGRARLNRIPGKRASEYTPADWRKLVDSAWGPGQPAATQLAIFDFYWNTIDQQFGGFPYITVNWDSVRTLFRPEVAAGVSRGRFDAIMCQLYYPLMEMHTYCGDACIDSSFFQGSEVVFNPDVPVFWTNGWGSPGNFGAGLTPLPDSALLVYRTVLNHPLGIMAGDIVLGYEGVPWKKLYKRLLDAQLPFEWWYGWCGSTPRSLTHSLLTSAANNWGLFDSIDVVKYPTGDTVHLPTSPLRGLEWTSIYATEQVPIKGVPFPDHFNSQNVSYGVIEGTTIGYVYVWQWNAEDGYPFAAALLDLIGSKSVTGLILDFRYNVGSGNSSIAAFNGFDYLFNESPGGTTRWRNAARLLTWDHLSLYATTPFDAYVVMGPGYYDRPIAVLTGPHARSMGDLFSFEMRFHPMARFFGLPTNGSFPAPGTPRFSSTGWDTWYFDGMSGQMQSLVNNEGFLMHKGFPVDEEVWLTRDNVAKGKDDVVERAVAWITTVAHVHTVRMTQPVRDSIRITAVVANPLSHAIALTAILSDVSNVQLDTVALGDDGKHGDGAAGDGMWGGYYSSLSTGTIRASIRTVDMNAGTSRTFRNMAELLFTRGAKITGDPAAINLGPLDRRIPRIDTSFVIRNIGWAGDTVTVAVDPGNVDPDTAVSVSPKSFVLAPQDSHRVTFTVRPPLLPLAYYGTMVTVSSGSLTFKKTFEFQIVVAVRDEHSLPTEYSLAQNYPNPFNPSTTIRYGLPEPSHVSLSVYNTLGQQVAVLQNGEQEAGYHEVTFDASALPSGVFFYRLQAGSYVKTRKLCMMR
jgi:hypothetical protein